MESKKNRLFTDKYYKEKIEVKIDDEKDEKTLETKGAKDKEEKKVELFNVYLKELYTLQLNSEKSTFKEPIYFDNEKKEQKMGDFRQDSNPDYIELKRQIILLIHDIKKWCIKNKIPSDVTDDYKEWDKFAERLFNPSYLNDSFAIEVFTTGKIYLEKIAFELYKDNSNETAAARAIQGLYTRLPGTCAEGLNTEFFNTKLEFSSSREEISLAARVAVAQQFAAELCLKKYPSIRPGMHTHYVVALCNHFAQDLKIPVIPDSYQDQVDISTELEIFKKFILSEKFHEQELDKMIDFYVNKLNLSLYAASNTDAFMKSLDECGSYPLDCAQNYFDAIESKEDEPLLYMPKKTDELRNAIKKSIMTRMINDKLINQEYFVPILLKDKKETCSLITINNYPDEKNATFTTDYAYAVLKPEVSFMVSSTPPLLNKKSILKSLNTPFAYVLYENDLYFISKEPTRMVRQEQKNIGNIKIKLNASQITDVFTTLAMDQLQFIEKATGQSLRNIYYIQKTPFKSHQLNCKNIDEIYSMQETSDTKSLDEIDRATKYARKENEKICLYVNPDSVELSWVQYSEKGLQEESCQLFIDYFKELDEEKQLEMIKKLSSSEVDVTPRFLFQCAAYIKKNVIDSLFTPQQKTSDIVKIGFLLALKQKNIKILKEYLETEEKEDKNITAEDIFTTALLCDMANVFWKEYPTIPEGIKCTSALFIKSYRMGNCDFSKINFTDVDFKEIKIAENPNQKLIFRKSNLKDAKNFSSILTPEVVKRLDLEGAILNTEQFIALYNYGRRDFCDIDLRHIDFRQVIFTNTKDLLIDRADLRGASLDPFFITNVKSKKNARFDVHQLKEIISRPRQNWEIHYGQEICYEIDLSDLNFENEDFKEVDLLNLRINSNRNTWIFFDRSNFKKANLFRVFPLQKTSFTRVSLFFNACNFADANLADTDFNSWRRTYGANYKSVDFSRIPKSHISIFNKSCILDRKSFESYVKYQHKDIRGAIVIDKDLDKKPLDLRGILLDKIGLLKLIEQGQRNFSGVVMLNADLSTLDLSNLDFTGASFSGVNFDKATIENTIFDESTILSSSFIHTNLNHSSFMSTKCETVTFEYAQLKNSIFSNVKLDGKCEFSHTIFAGLPKNYIALINFKEAAILQCLKFLKEYAKPEGFIYRHFSPDPFKTTAQNLLDKIKKGDFKPKNVNDIENELVQLSKCSLFNEILSKIFKICTNLEKEQTPKMKINETEIDKNTNLKNQTYGCN